MGKRLSRKEAQAINQAEAIAEYFGRDRRNEDLAERQEGNVLLVQFEGRDVVYDRTDSGEYKPRSQ